MAARAGRRTSALLGVIAGAAYLAAVGCVPSALTSDERLDTEDRAAAENHPAAVDKGTAAARPTSLDAINADHFCDDDSKCTVLALDLNGDKREDSCTVEVTSRHWKSRCTVSDGEGSTFGFSYAVDDTHDTGDYAGWRPLAADVDGDGNKDLCVHHVGSDRWMLRCARSRGNGQFQTDPYKQLASSDHSANSHVLVQDIDGDRRDDFCLSSLGDGEWKVRCAVAYGGDEWRSSAYFALDAGNYSVWEPFSLDTDGDQRADQLCAIAKGSNGLHARCAQVRFDASSGRFSRSIYPHRVLDANGDYRAWKLVTVDFDGDKDQDLCVFHPASDDLYSRCIEYLGAGAFGSALRIKRHQVGEGVAPKLTLHAGDVDGDGREDICLTFKDKHAWSGRCLRALSEKGEFETLPRKIYDYGDQDNWQTLMLDSNGDGLAEPCIAQKNRMGGKYVRCVRPLISTDEQEIYYSEGSSKPALTKCTVNGIAVPSDQVYAQFKYGKHVNATVGFSEGLGSVGASFYLHPPALNGDFKRGLNVLEGISAAGAGWQTSFFGQTENVNGAVYVHNQAAGNLKNQWGYRGAPKMTDFASNGAYKRYTFDEWLPVPTDHSHDVAGFSPDFLGSNFHAPCDTTSVKYFEAKLLVESRGRPVLGAPRGGHFPSSHIIQIEKRYSLKAVRPIEFRYFKLEQAFYLDKWIAAQHSLRVYFVGPGGAWARGPVYPHWDKYWMPDAPETMAQIPLAGALHENPFIEDAADDSWGDDRTSGMTSDIGMVIFVWRFEGQDIAVAIHKKDYGAFWGDLARSVAVRTRWEKQADGTHKKIHPRFDHLNPDGSAKSWDALRAYHNAGNIEWHSFVEGHADLAEHRASFKDGQVKTYSMIYSIGTLREVIQLAEDTFPSLKIHVDGHGNMTRVAR